MNPSDSSANPGNSSEKTAVSAETSRLINELRAKADEVRARLLPSAETHAAALKLQTAARSSASSPLASRIDHTLLKAEATRDDHRRLCREAREHAFATVCVNSAWIPFVAQELTGAKTLPIAVVGFPLGAASSAAKAFETRQAVADGAREIDMVVPVGLLKAREYDAVFRDLRAVVEAAAPYPVKVILETSLLSLEEKIAACCLSQAAGAAFVKTSTGFGGGGATVEDIRLMRETVGPAMGVKASGGIRTSDDARRMIEAGADRLGASASVAIVEGGVGQGY